MLGFLFCGIITSCTIGPVIQDKEFIPYIERFAADTNQPLDKILKTNSIAFTEIETPDEKKNEMYVIIGQCNLATLGVSIDRSNWKTESIQTKTALIHHELGHCYCLIGHVEAELKDGCPDSIMNPLLPSEACLEKHWDRYIDDLKDRCE